MEDIEVVKPNGSIPSSEITGALEEMPTRLSEEHMELYVPAFQSCIAANDNLVAAQERLNQAILGQKAAAGALSYVMGFLKPKYQMTPTDDFDSEGGILRKGDA